MSAKTGQEAVSGRQAQQMMRRFDRFLLQDDALVEQYGRDQAEVMRAEMGEELRRLIPQVPYIGGKQNPLTTQLVQSAGALAIYRVVLKHGDTLEDTGELLHRLFRAEVERIPRVLRPWVKRYMFSRLRRRQALKEASRSQARRYPGDWVFERVDGDGSSFDQGRDYTECGIVKFLHAQDADALCPYLCDLDWVTAEVIGYGFQRTKTLAWGCDRCDFRMSKDGTTTAPWPPRFVERTCDQAPTARPESDPTH